MSSRPPKPAEQGFDGGGLKGKKTGPMVALVHKQTKGDAAPTEADVFDASDPFGGAAHLDPEVQAIKRQVEQARVILADAILKLGDSFKNLDRDSSEQKSLMKGLLDRLAGGESSSKGAVRGGSLSIHEFAKETTFVLTQFTDLLSTVSTQSMKSVNRIDDMANELEETFKLVSSVNDIADDTYLLAVNASIEAAHAGNAGRSFAVIAGNVRELSKKTRKFNHLIGAQIAKAQASVDDVRRIIAEMASRDLNVALAGKDRVQSMLRDVEELERFVARSVETANGAAGRISQSTSQAVTALQFEDIMTQLIASIGRHADRIGTERGDAMAVTGMLPQSADPVNQQSMAPGEVELF